MGRIAIISFVLFISACSIKTHEQTLSIINEIEQEYVPDGRTGIFTIKTSGINPVKLQGETNIEEAKYALIEKLSSAGIRTIDEIEILPAAQLGDKTYGLVNLSVANLRSKPAHSAELVTQALLGMPVNILKESDGWFLIQTPDKYIAWTNGGSVVPMNAADLDSWKKSTKIIYLNTTGFSMDLSNTNRMSDLVVGDVLVLEGESDNHWKVAYPDNRMAIISKTEAMELRTWHGEIVLSDSSITQVARSLQGLPYLWGGTSAKGVDCSGFTKTVYSMHGLVIPRDASQQVYAGDLVDSTGDFSRLEVGDLLFFGKKNEDYVERVIHVGLWLGNNQFIHASTDVHISSMDSLDTNFDAYNYQRYLRTKRLIVTTSPLISDFMDIY